MFPIRSWHNSGHALCLEIVELILISTGVVTNWLFFGMQDPKGWLVEIMNVVSSISISRFTCCCRSYLMIVK